MFTRAERQLIVTLLAGYTANRAIAQRTGKQERTIEKQLQGLYQKTQVHDKTQFVLWLVRSQRIALRHGQLSLREPPEERAGGA